MSQTIQLNVRPIYKCPKGHNQHRSGSGVHQDRRNRRSRTRQAQTQRAVREY